MQQYRFLTGRQRQIRLSGTYSWTARYQLDGAGVDPVLNTDGGITELSVPSLFVGFDKARTEQTTVFRLGPFLGMAPNIQLLEDPPGSNDYYWIWRDSAGIEAGRRAFSLLLSEVITFSDSGTFELSIDVDEAFRYLNTSEESSPNYLAESYFEAQRPGGFLQAIIVSSRGAVNLGSGVPFSAYSVLSDDWYYPYLEAQVDTAAGQGGSLSWSCTVDYDGFTKTPKAVSAAAGGSSATESAISVSSSGGTPKTVGYTCYFPVERKYTVKVRGYTFAALTLDLLTATLKTSDLDAGITDSAAGEVTFSNFWQYWRAGASIHHGAVVQDLQQSYGPAGASGEAVPSRVTRFGARASLPGSAETYFDYHGQKTDIVSYWQEQYRYITRDPFQPLAVTPGSDRGWGAVIAPTSTVTIVSGSPDAVRIVTPAEYNGGFGPPWRNGAVLVEDFSLDSRFVEIEIRSVGAANQPFRMAVQRGAATAPTASHAWVGTTGEEGQWVTRRFDVFAASDLAAVGSFPLNFYPPATLARPRPVLTTVAPAQSFERLYLDNLDWEATYEVRFVRGVRRNFSRLDVVKGLPVGTTDLTPTSPSVLPPISALLPGQNPSSWVRTDLAPPTPGKPDFNDEFSPGLVTYADADLLFESDYLGLYGFELQAKGGRTRDGVILDEDAEDSGAPVTVPAYRTGRWLSLYPGCGEVFKRDGGVFAEETEVTFAKTLRFGLYGGVIGDTAAGEEVVLQETDGATPEPTDVAERGRGEIGALEPGFFRTGDPFGRPLKEDLTATPHATWVDAAHEKREPLADVPPAQVESFQGVYRWLLWRLQNPSPPDSLSHPLFGYYAHLLRDSNGNLVFQRTMPGGAPDRPDAFDDVTVTVRDAEAAEVTATAPTLTLNPGVIGEMRAAWEEDGDDSSGVVEAVSYDDGATWPTKDYPSEGWEAQDPAMVIEGGRTPRYFVGATGWDAGILGLAAFVETEDGDGVIKAVLLKENGEWTDPFTFSQKDGAQTLKPLPVKNMGFDFIQMNEGPGRWLLTVMIAGEEPEDDDETEFSIWACSDLTEGRASFTRITEPPP